MLSDGPNVILMLNQNHLPWALSAVAAVSALWLVVVAVVVWRRSRWDVPLDEYGVTPL